MKQKREPSHPDGRTYRDLSFGIPGATEIAEDQEAVVKKAISFVASVSEETRSSLNEKTKIKLVKARGVINKYGPSLFARAFQDEWQDQFWTDDQLGSYTIDIRQKRVRGIEEILAQTKVPKLNDTSGEAIEEAILKIQHSTVAINGALENLIPALKEMEDLERRMIRTIKAIHAGTTEWRGESIAYLWIPPYLFNKKVAVMRAVTALQTRRTSLDNSFEMISRLVTVSIGSPTGEIGIERKKQFLSRQDDDDSSEDDGEDSKTHDTGRNPYRRKERTRAQPTKGKSSLTNMFKPSGKAKK